MDFAAAVLSMSVTGGVIALCAALAVATVFGVTLRQRTPLPAPTAGEPVLVRLRVEAEQGVAAPRVVIELRDEDGVVLSARKPRCVGCNNCVLACPFGVPKMEPEFDLMMKCDMCYDRTSVGKTPMCATLERASTVLLKFLSEHPARYPPLVVNVTDGEATDGDPEQPVPPDETGRVVILTSGTTGTPKGAPRSEPRPRGIMRRA